MSVLKMIYYECSKSIFLIIFGNYFMQLFAELYIDFSQNNMCRYFFVSLLFIIHYYLFHPFMLQIIVKKFHKYEINSEIYYLFLLHIMHL